MQTVETATVSTPQRAAKRGLISAAILGAGGVVLVIVGFVPWSRARALPDALFMFLWLTYVIATAALFVGAAVALVRVAGRRRRERAQV